MILFYTALSFLLWLVHRVIRLRVARLEKRYVATSLQTETLMKQPVHKAGNTNRADPYQSAKQQVQLGMLVQKRDNLETLYTRWQTLADRVGGLRTRIKNAKGRLTPYAMGALDVGFAVWALPYVSQDEYVGELVQMVTGYLSR